MQSSKKIKILILVIVLFFGAMGTLFFVASKKLNPEELSVLIIEQVENAIPNSKVTTQSVDLSLGLLSTSLDLKQFNIVLNNKKMTPLFKVEALSLKIPLWSILFGGGKITLKIDQPILDYEEFQKSSNWEIALTDKRGKKSKDSKREVSKNGTKKITKEESGSLPAFIVSSLLDVEIKGLKLSYKLRDKSSGLVNIEKLLLKDVGLQSVTAFEIKSHIEILKNTANETKLDLLLIGETKISDFLKNNELKLKTNLSLRKVHNASLKRDISSLQVNTLMTVKKSGDVNGDFKVILEEREALSGKITKSEALTKIEDLKVSLNIKSLAEIVVDLNKLPIQLSGDENFELGGKLELGKVIKPFLNFSINKPIGISQAGVSISNNVSGQINDKSTNVNIDSTLFKGKSRLNVVVPGNITQIKPEQLPKIDVKLSVRDIVAPQKYFEFVYKNKTEETTTNAPAKEEKAPKETVAKPIEQLSPLPVDLTVDLQNINVNEVIVAGLLNVEAGKEKVDLNISRLMIDSGIITNKTSLFLVNKKINAKFDTSLQSLNIASAKSFVPKEMVEGISGNINGRIKGTIKNTKYDTDVKIKLTNGKLTRVNLKDSIEGFLGSLSKYSKKIDKKDIKVDGGFKELSLNGRFTNENYGIRSFKFFDDKDQVSLNGKGNVRLRGDSLLETSLVIVKPRFKKNLMREIGKNSFPMQLKGKGFALKPDYTKALRSIAKSAAKTQVKKQAKKQVKKQIQKIKDKNLKKLLKNKKVDKLLKGLF